VVENPGSASALVTEARRGPPEPPHTCTGPCGQGGPTCRALRQAGAPWAPWHGSTGAWATAGCQAGGRRGRVGRCERPVRGAERLQARGGLRQLCECRLPQPVAAVQRELVWRQRCQCLSGRAAFQLSVKVHGAGRRSARSLLPRAVMFGQHVQCCLYSSDPLAGSALPTLAWPMPPPLVCWPRSLGRWQVLTAPRRVGKLWNLHFCCATLGSHEIGSQQPVCRDRRCILESG